MPDKQRSREAAIDRNRSLCNIAGKFYVQLPHGSKPTRINVHRFWRGEIDELAATFPAEALAGASGAPVTG